VKKLPTTQHYLITVQRMCTSDEADLVAGWSAVVAEENLSAITLTDAAKLTAMPLDKAPMTNIRPMTEAEIKEWRDAEKAKD
jgi:hypothetical protein